jgi:hypothetical protein
MFHKKKRIDKKWAKRYDWFLKKTRKNTTINVAHTLIENNSLSWGVRGRVCRKDEQQL